VTSKSPGPVSSAMPPKRSSRDGGSEPRRRLTSKSPGPASRKSSEQADELSEAPAQSVCRLGSRSSKDDDGVGRPNSGETGGEKRGGVPRRLGSGRGLFSARSDSASDEPRAARPVGSRRDEQALEVLLKRQRQALPNIMKELTKYNEKRGHYIWWIFPTSMPGAADPFQTYVTNATAPALFSSETSEVWQEVLEKICEMIDASGMKVLPRIDHGRIYYFLQLWKDVPEQPEWFAAVIERLGRYKWPMR